MQNLKTESAFYVAFLQLIFSGQTPWSLTNNGLQTTEPNKQRSLTNNGLLANNGPTLKVYRLKASEHRQPYSWYRCDNEGGGYADEC